MKEQGTDNPGPVYGPVFRWLRKLWRLLPKDLRRSLWETLGPKVQSAYARFWLARPARHVPADPQAPLVVAGLFSTANGIGAAARATYRALCAAGLSPIAVDLSGILAPADLDSGIPCQPMPDSHEGVLILQQNGPEIASALHHLGMHRGRNWFTIGYWAWELADFPQGWERAFPYLSELWTISDFAAGALTRHPKAPAAHTFPHAIDPPESVRRDRAQFGWPEEAFVFLAFADSMSSLERKNPLGAIAAFRLAFADDQSFRLVIKTRNLERDPLAHANLHKAVEGAENIEILDVSLTEEKIWELLQAADAVISLHRAEGFGLVLAEAMALGKPVVATAWSGNMDFMDETKAYLVDQHQVVCEDAYGVYKYDTAHWAEPDIAAAASQLRALVTNPEETSARVRAAQARIREFACSRRIGAMMAERLERTWGEP
nr:glycosyltransferase family 4 protein [uncultured Hyphomonas sp.]